PLCRLKSLDHNRPVSFIGGPGIFVLRRKTPRGPVPYSPEQPTNPKMVLAAARNTSLTPLLL
ncbi:MAG TPA: hypothetical protein PKD90_14360, partial [Phnomibacter sp.]|nr:hypothetical protein [Phnomibacter sp.]